MRKKTTEMQALIKKSVDDLGSHNQPQLVGDIFEIYFKEHVQKMQKTVENPGDIEDKFLYEITMSTYKFAQKERGLRILETVVSSCTCKDFNEYNKLICAEIAKVYHEDKIFTKAYVSVLTNFWTTFCIFKLFAEQI